MNDLDFMQGYKVDPNDINMNNFKTIPVGNWLCIVEEAEVRVSKQNSNDKNLFLRLQIIDGPYKGRFLYDNICIVHHKIETQQQAKRAYNALCVATGVMEPKNIAQFKNIPIIVQTKIIKDEKYGDSEGNKAVVKQYYNKNNPKVSQSVQNQEMQPQSQVQETQQNNNVPSWAQNR